MARYIDIEGAGIGKANREQFLVPEFADGWNAVLKILEKEPTADVEEVVRCEKCKYLKHTRGYIPYCKRMDEYADGDNLYEVSYDDFCSYGERRDNNG